MRFEYLADCRELIPALARWHFDYWQDLVPDWSYEGAVADLSAHRERLGIPETIVAFDGVELQGSVSLVADDLPGLPPYTPWLASLFVLPTARGRGVGRALVEQVVRDATALGVERLHLLTTDAEPYYRRQGFTILETLTYRGFPAWILGRALRFPVTS
jgi:N-acetylglutamate synthase-like GNAT family acetyltransferase